MTANISRGFFWFFCIAVALVSYRIFVLGMEAGYPDMKQHFSHSALFWAHVIGASTALLLMPFQFWTRLRNRRRILHRRIGRTYVVAVLIAGVAGLYMSFFSITGAVAGAGFFLLAVFWLATTWMAYAKARARDFTAHRVWMVRSAALTFAAVTLRIYIPVSQIAGLPFDTSYTVIAWICWVPNLLLVLWWQRRGPQPQVVTP